jgi:hypothetical protein
MAGKIKKMIDIIILENAKGNETLINLTKAKLTLKGINPKKFDVNTEDNPEIIEKLKIVANDMGIIFK